MRARKSLFYFLAESSTKAFGLVSTYLIAHHLGADALGTIGYMLSLVGMFTVALDLNLGYVHMRHSAENNDLGVCVGTYLFLKIILFVVFLLALLVWGMIWPNFYQIPNIENSFLIFLIIVICYSLNHFENVFTSTFWAREEAVRVHFPTIFSSIVKMFGCIAIVWLKLGVMGLAYVYLIESVVSFLIAWGLFSQKRIPINLPTSVMIKRYFHYALPIILVVPLSTAAANLDRLMIGRFADVTQVGYFFATQGLLAIVSSISGSVVMALLPKISADALKNKNEIETLINRAVRYLTLMLIPFTIFIMYFSKAIVRLVLGEKFIDAAPILFYFSIGYFIAMFVRLYGNTLYGLDKHKRITETAFVNLFVLAGCNYLFIHQFKLGALGAVYSNIIVWIVAGFSYISLVRKSFKIGHLDHLLKPGIAGVTMWTFLYLTGQFIHYPQQAASWADVVKTIVLVVVSLSAYLGLLAVMKEFTKKDKDYLLDIFNISKMKTYIFSELK